MRGEEVGFPLGLITRERRFEPGLRNDATRPTIRGTPATFSPGAATRLSAMARVPEASAPICSRWEDRTPDLSHVKRPLYH